MGRLGFAIALVLVACAVGCARQPSQGTATRVIERHFRRYARHYPTSAFGTASVTRVTVDDIEEWHKRYVTATGTVHFQDGRTSAVRCAIEQRPPRGWRVVSWERID